MNHELNKSIILGTAGHIDHGKSSLVKALTGVDPDRLKEEKERGITIDLGFANLSYPDDGLTVGIVDVPGHERLIKNMLAGAGGIDIVLMVIASDEGVMPQSREHLDICELLKVKTGIIVITKADLVDAEWLYIVTDDIKKFVKGTFLESADMISVSAKTGLNIDTLKEKIQKIALNVKPKLTDDLFRMPIDRVFTLKGFGTVVTGTVISGAISLDKPIEILPSKITNKVRGLQSHGKSVTSSRAGQRIGINLQGLDKRSLKRGDVVVSPGRFVPTKVVDAKLEMLNGAPSVKSRSLVHFYSGTSETTARIIIYDPNPDINSMSAGESCYCQFRLKEPIVVLSGDRYIIRRFSPLETIGGGEILDPHPVKRKRKEGLSDLNELEKGDIKDKIENKIKRTHFRGCSISEVMGWIQGGNKIKLAVQQLLNEGRLMQNTEHRTQNQESRTQKGLLFHKDIFNSFKESAVSVLKRFHRNNPLKSGMPKEGLKAKIMPLTSHFSFFISEVEDVVVEKDIIRLKNFKVSLSMTDKNIRDRIFTVFNKDGFQPPLKTEITQKLSIGEKELNDLLIILVNQGVLMRINDSMYITTKQYDKMIALLKSFYSKKDEMTVAEFRDILSTTRKYALPFLEYLDWSKVTLRVGDTRKFMLK